MLDPNKKDTPCPRAKEKPLQDGTRGKISFRIKPHTRHKCSKDSNKTLCTPGPRDLTETEPDLPLSVWVSPAEAQVSSGLPWEQGLWLQQTREAQRVNPTEWPGRQPTNWRTIIPKKFPHCCESTRVHNRFPNLGIQQRDWESPENLTLKASRIWLQNFHRTGETDSWRAQTKPCAHQDPGERSSGPTRDWARLAWKCPGVSRGDVNWQWPATGSVSLTTTVLGAMGADLSPFAEIHHYPYHSLTSGQITGKELSPTHQQKIGSKSYWAWPCSPKQDPIFTIANSSNEEASASFSSSSIRGQTEWKPESQKTN